MIQPVLASNQYIVNEGSKFKWNATKYLWIKDGLGLGNPLLIEDNFYLAFNFTNWADYYGSEYINGTVDKNGTNMNGELSHEYYDYDTGWMTSILDRQGDYPVYIYLICDSEIEQTTIPSMQNLANNSWINYNEPNPYNFTLSGTDVEGQASYTYVGNVVFNSDKVLTKVYDELFTYSGGVLARQEKYVWTLTSYQNVSTNNSTNTDNNNNNNNPNSSGGSIPGFPLFALVAAIMTGFIFVEKKKIKSSIKKS